MTDDTITPTRRAATAAGVDRILDLFTLDGDVAVVTGASSGIGQAAAEILAGAGARVAVLGRDEARLAEVTDGIRSSGGVASAFPLDITDGDALADTFARIREEHGAPAIVVANAGIAGGPSYAHESGALSSVPDDAWEQAVATNLTATFRTLQEGARSMADGGRMIVTSSTAGMRADPFVGYGYIATKAALLNVVRQASLEFAPRGIRVNALAPGPFKTRIGGSLDIPDEVEQRWAATVPLGRMGDVGDLQGAVLFLASQASRFVTGTTVVVDGGALALSHASF
jgi:NAD(P)-dependent dehydrogenase (short-subunit alcohol dehydrogenase family)